MVVPAAVLDDGNPLVWGWDMDAHSPIGGAAPESRLEDPYPIPELSTVPHRSRVIRHRFRGSTMPRWKKRATEFPVMVNNMRSRNACTCSLSRPLLEYMGDPDTIVFVIDAKYVRVEIGDVEVQ